MLYDNILVPYDGSPSAHSALAEAIRFAKDDPGLSLRIMQIVNAEQLVVDLLQKSDKTKASVESSEEWRNLYDKGIATANERLHHQVDGLLKGLMNPITIELVEETLPGEQIVAYAADNHCDLIIMGSRGLGALRGILGSVSNHVLREADVPVLIVKHGE